MKEVKLKLILTDNNKITSLKISDWKKNKALNETCSKTNFKAYKNRSRYLKEVKKKYTLISSVPGHVLGLLYVIVFLQNSYKQIVYQDKEIRLREFKIVK